MRVFIAALVLIFSLQSWTKAEDIRDFEIEGMSLYDSALEYFEPNELTILENNYKSNEYSTATVYSSKFSTYESLQISFKTVDKKYKILDITGNRSIDYQSCISGLDKFDKEFSIMFSKAKKLRNNDYPHPMDKSGETRVTDIYWYLDFGDVIIVQCYNWNSKLGKANNWQDDMKITVGSKEFDDFIIHKAFK